MEDDKAKRAVEAREHMQEMLLQCSEALAQAGQIMSLIATELAVAIQEEQEATQDYIIELEKKLSRQQALS